MFSGKRKREASEAKPDAASIESAHALVIKLNSELDQLKPQLSELRQRFESLTAKLEKAQQALDELTIYKICSSDPKIPDNLTEENKESANLLLKLLQLLSTKFFMGGKVRGKFNRLDNKNVVSFSNEKYTKYNDKIELECKPAIDYFKALGFEPTEQGRGILGARSLLLTLDISQCKAAISGLGLLEPLTKEKEEARLFAKC